MPKSLEPELATLVPEAPLGAEWLHEIKLDGYRLLCRVERGKAKLLTRRQLDWTHRFPPIVQAVEELGVKSAVLDGEVVVAEADGISSFAALQTARRKRITTACSISCSICFTWTATTCRGAANAAQGTVGETPGRTKDEIAAPTQRAYRRRRARVPAAMLPTWARGGRFQRRDRPYRAGRGGDWLKAKCIQREEFVIGGFTDPTASRQGLGALLVGYFDRPGHLLYAGRVGTGFSARKLVELRRALDRLEQKNSPYANLTAREAGRGVHWVAPSWSVRSSFPIGPGTMCCGIRHFRDCGKTCLRRRFCATAPVPGGLAETSVTKARSRRRR